MNCHQSCWTQVGVVLRTSYIKQLLFPEWQCRWTQRSSCAAAFTNPLNVSYKKNIYIYIIYICFYIYTNYIFIIITIYKYMLSVGNMLKHLCISYPANAVYRDYRNKHMLLRTAMSFSLSTRQRLGHQSKDCEVAASFLCPPKVAVCSNCPNERWHRDVLSCKLHRAMKHRKTREQLLQLVMIQ